MLYQRLREQEEKIPKARVPSATKTYNTTQQMKTIASENNNNNKTYKKNIELNA